MKLNVKRMELAAALGLLFTLTVSSFCGFARDCAQVRGEVLRIQILANSDSEMDQTVKLMVRDEILRHTDELIVTDGSLDSTVTSMRQHLEEAEQIADNVLAEQGMSYTARAEVVDMYFNTRHYQNGEEEFYMPAGRYQALRITLGSGTGKNWWCVAYPPMCIDAAADGEAALVEDEIYALNDTVTYRPKFAVVELVESLREKLGI